VAPVRWGPKRAQEVEQLIATGVVWAAEAAGEGEGVMTRKVEQLRLQKGVFGVCVIARKKSGATRPGMLSNRMPRMSSGQPRLQRSAVREVEGVEPRMSKAREAGKSRLKRAGSTTQERGPEGDVKSSRSSVSLGIGVKEKSTL
jgi:hypothetical protein